MAKNTKNIKLLIILVLITAIVLITSCRDLPKLKISEATVSYSTLDTSQEKLSDEEYSIQLVQWSQTKGLPSDKRLWKALKYGTGYVINYSDKGFWYVENDVVYNLNDIAVEYCANNKLYYGIKWAKLFGIASSETEEEEAPISVTETLAQEETTVAVETTIVSEDNGISGEIMEAAGSSVLKFYTITSLPKIWGARIRLSEPPLIDFSDVYLDIRLDEIEVSGDITGSSYIEYCNNPDTGLSTMISAVIISQEGDVQWQQDGTPGYDSGETSFIKTGDVKSFSLINSSVNPVNVGDSLIIIAYTQGNMPEDIAAVNVKLDKSIYGSYVGALEETMPTLE